MILDTLETKYLRIVAELRAEIERLRARIAEHERGLEWIKGTIAERDGKIEWLQSEYETAFSAGYEEATEGYAAEIERLREALSWIENHDPQIVEAAREKLAPAGKEGR